MTWRTMTHHSLRGIARGAALVGFALASAGPLRAQQGDPGAGRPHAAGQRMTPEARAQMEEQFRQRLGAVIMRELGLTAEQARELEQVNRRMEAERAPILRRERELRHELRASLEATPDERRIEGLLAELVSIEAQRAALLEREQRALSAFLRPSQRARYLSLQENVRRRLLQRQSPGAPGEPPRRRPPG